MYKSDREFKLWDYNVSHQQLLLRSPRTGDQTANIDVLFWGVAFVRVPTVLQGLDVQLENDSVRSDEQGFTFSLTSEGKTFSVVASGCKVLKNELEVFDSSLVYFDRDRDENEYGEVLARS